MLATLNSRQIVDEIVKDTVKDNDPHDAVQISPETVLSSRSVSVAPTLAPEIAAVQAAYEDWIEADGRTDVLELVDRALTLIEAGGKLRSSTTRSKT